MSSAPPGWHLQPDGRERFWDGERWTDEFREPESTPTEQIPLGETRGMPTTPRQDQASGNAGAGSGGYGSPPPGGHREEYPREPYYDQGGPLSDKPGGMPGWLKGCLIALVVLVLLAVIAVAVGWWLFSRATDSTAEPEQEQTVTQTAAPTAEPTEPTSEPTDGPTLPTGIPTTLPTDLPTIPGSGVTVQVGLGEGFTFGPAEVQEGWSIESQSLGFKSVTMTVIPQESSSVPLVFTMRFLSGAEELATTICTAQLSAVGEEDDVACIPMRGEPENADEVEVSGLGGN